MSWMSKKLPNSQSQWLQACGLIVLATLLQACGGGGGGSSSPLTVDPMTVAETGQIVVVLTDAEGDFAAYTVTVTSVLLEKANGTTVETLPLSTSVDFAELTEVTEFLTIATVPAGVYESVSLGLDFSNAEILVQDDQGDEVLAEPLDEQDNPLLQLTVRLHLASTDTIRIAPGIPAAFSLDFDLDASNEIDLTVTPPTVTVLPFLLASAELEADRAHRLRGVLASVDEAASEATLMVRPFRHRTGDFGEFTFFADENTLFEIDGEASSGAEGLASLAMKPEETPVVALGMIVDGRYLASHVLAGTSVSWAQADVVKGIVTAREADTLLVRGAKIEYRDGVTIRRGEIRVHLGENTKVTALGLDNSTLNKDSISVGQLIVAFGELLDDISLDATESHVRMQVSQLTATVLEASPLIASLHYLNGRRLGIFDFSGTGSTPEDDADLENYELHTATLPLTTVDAGDLVQVRGHVNTFGMAPADFNALTVIDLQTDMRAAMFAASWENATGQPFLALDPARIDLDLSEARALLKVRGVPVEWSNSLNTLALLGTNSEFGVYAVRVRGAGEIHLYRNFSDLVNELIQQLDSGNLLKRVGAHGRYTMGDAELTTGRASFEFVEPVSQ